MNTPYPEPRANLEDLRHLFHEHNDGIERARAEYEAHPTAACAISERCYNLTPAGDFLCPTHRESNDAAAVRSQVARDANRAAVKS